jgi:DNA-binding YbaB/EbfC family protein
MPQPNIQNMLKQAQEVMAAQQEAQEALKEQKVEASAGGGMVKVVVSGDLKLESLVIDPDAVDPEDVEMLQDLVLAATNEALRQAVELQEKAMQGASGAGGFDPMEALQGLGLGDALGGLGGGGAPGLPGGGGAPGMNRAARRAAAKKNR